jgi:hypothetical protein
MRNISREQAVEEWAAALRSGKYKQGNGYLNRGGEFCCLGVLCEVLEVEKKGGYRDVICYADVEAPGRLGSGGADMGLPVAVAKFMGMDFYGAAIDDDRDRSLSELNDDGSNFSSIANMIERDFNGDRNYFCHEID